MFRFRKCRRSHHLVHILIFFPKVWEGDIYPPIPTPAYFDFALRHAPDFCFGIQVLLGLNTFSHRLSLSAYWRLDSALSRLRPAVCLSVTDDSMFPPCLPRSGGGGTYHVLPCSNIKVYHVYKVLSRFSTVIHGWRVEYLSLLKCAHWVKGRSQLAIMVQLESESYWPIWRAQNHIGHHGEAGLTIIFATLQLLEASTLSNQSSMGALWAVKGPFLQVEY